MADARAITVCALATALLGLSVAAQTPQAEPQHVVDTFGRGAYRPSGGKPALKLTRFVEPSAPNATADAPAEPVMVEAIVRSNGFIEYARLAAPQVSPFVAREALRVVKGWAFRPPLLDGREVSVLATFLVDFTKGRPVPTEVYDKDEPGIDLPKLVQAVLPGYTPEALRRGISGTVELVVIVLPNGRVGHTSLVKSLDAASGLDRLALAAVAQCHFVPARLHGREVAFRTEISSTFVLK